MVHTAEGELYRSAIARAAKDLNLRCVRVPERDLYKVAAKQLHIPEPKLRVRITEMGRSHRQPVERRRKMRYVGRVVSPRRF